MTFTSTVVEAINKFINNYDSFTSVDVVAEVKKTMPSVYHNSVADEIRYIFSKGIPEYSYTYIDVTKADGSIATARLYHPVWDVDVLDIVYPESKRKSTTAQVHSAFIF